MLLENLFSSNAAASPGKSGNAAVNENRNVGARGVSDGNESFSNVFSREVKDVTGEDDQIQDSTVKENKAERKAAVHKKAAVDMTESEAYDMEKEMEELAEEVKEIITYICALLGISVENADEVITEFLKDADLVSGEAADFLANASDAGAKNVPLMKMKGLVKLLKKAADFIKSAETANPKDAVFDALIAKGITEKQNQFKGLSVVSDKETKSLVDFAKVINVLEEAAQKGSILAKAIKGSDVSGDITENGLSTDNDFTEDLLHTVEQKAEPGTAIEVGPKTDEVVKELSPTVFAPISSGEVSDSEEGSSQTESAAVPKVVLSQIGKRDLDNSGNESFKESSKEAVDTSKGESGSAKKNDILESMKVNVIRGSDENDLETAVKEGDVKLTVDVLKTVEDTGKAEFKNMGAFKSLLNIKSSPIIDRALKIDVISQIMDKAKIVLKNGRNMMNIQLKPERLGEVFMKISVEDGRVMAKVVTDSLMAKEAIETSLYQLKESLSTQGIKIDKFNVFVGDKWQEQSGQSNFNYQPDSKNGKGYNDQKEIEALKTDMFADPVPLELEQLDAGRLDFIA
jgi:flagellar hook-length control protein FliK